MVEQLEQPLLLLDKKQNLPTYQYKQVLYSAFFHSADISVSWSKWNSYSLFFVFSLL